MIQQKKKHVHLRAKHQEDNRDQKGGGEQLEVVEVAVANRPNRKS